MSLKVLKDTMLSVKTCSAIWWSIHKPLDVESIVALSCAMESNYE
jgi:hypothetical protein